MKLRNLLSGGALLGVVACGSLLAQDTAWVTGTVTDSTGATLPGARVTLATRRTASNVARQAGVVQHDGNCRRRKAAALGDVSNCDRFISTAVHEAFTAFHRADFLRPLELTGAAGRHYTRECLTCQASVE